MTLPNDNEVKQNKNYKANFLWGQEGELEVALYEFANGETEAYRELQYKRIKSIQENKIAELREQIAKGEVSEEEIIDILTSIYFRTEENITANGREKKCLLTSTAKIFADALLAGKKGQKE